MDQVREVLRYHHYSIRTEEAYVRWVLQFIRFNDKKHPKDMGKADIERILSHLAVNRKVAASTQNQAMKKMAQASLIRYLLNLIANLIII